MAVLVVYCGQSEPDGLKAEVPSAYRIIPVFVFICKGHTATLSLVSLK